MRPTITKKGDFNGLHNLLRKLFWNKIFFYSNFSKLYIYTANEFGGPNLVRG